MRIKDYLSTIWIPVVAAAALTASIGFAAANLPMIGAFANQFLVLRGALMVAGGYLAMGRGFGWTGAGFAGVMVFFVEHVLVFSAWFLISGQYGAIRQVLSAFAMFFWVPFLLGLLGGVFARGKFGAGERSNADKT